MSETPYPEFNDEGKVNCQICGRSFLVITPSHLKKDHNVTLEQYKARFPDLSLSSEEFKIRGKFGKISLFKEDKKLDVVEVESLEKEDSPVIEEIDFSAAELTEVKSSDPITMTKRRILKALKESFPNTVENFLIQKTNLNGIMEYEFISDFADPVLKIDFEFPKAFWHNKDGYLNLNRKDILERNGWKVVDFHSITISQDDLKTILSR